MSEWLPIESAQNGKKILLHYKNKLGKGRVVIGFKLEKFQEINNTDDNCEWCDYNEEDGEYYSPAGWYEAIDNWDEYSSIIINDGVPTHWMPLPEPPK